MKKIMIAGTFLLACATGTSLGQSTLLALNTDKNEIRLHQKDLTAKEKEFRKEERAIEKTQVSFFTRTHFERDFPDAVNVYYHAGKYLDEVDFNLNAVRYTAYYDEESDLVGTTTDQQLTDLPESAQKEIIKKYTDKGYTIDRIVLFDDNDAISYSF